MPRRKVRFVQGHYYHLYNRGAARQSIFLEDGNYTYLLRLLKKVAAESDVTIIAYCLMPNHYHWLVRQEGNTRAGEVPKRVFGSYSQAFNNTYNRSGTLFEGPYQAKAVGTDAYLHHLCCYIHANPVLHGFALSPDRWPYSNYLDWVGKRRGTLVDRSFIAEYYPESGQYAARVQAFIPGQVELPKGFRDYLHGLP